MQLAVCLLPVVPVRKEPSHRSEMVSQLLFGEYVQTGEERDEFVFVRGRYDGYEGWVQAKQLHPVKDVLHTTAYTAAFVTPVAVNGVLQHIPYASPVYQQSGASFSAAGCTVDYLLQPQQLWPEPLSVTAENLAAACQPYLNVPYLWGGKSVFGTDCSGFVQQVFKLFGVKLLRDAYLQAEQGRAVSFDERALGDLAFFQNEKGRVIHVGIVLNDDKIIHASGQVRIDNLQPQGIVNTHTGERTHKMFSIRRMTLK